MSIESFRARHRAGDGTLRGERIFSGRRLLEDVFADDPSYRNDVTLWPSGTSVPARVYNHTYRDSTATRRSIQTLLSHPFYPGTIFHMGEDGYWMCIEAYNAHQMYYQGQAEYCNYVIGFMSGGRECRYPVVMRNATQYNTGETVRSQLILGNSQYMVYIPCTEESLRMDHGARFLIDRNRERPTAYRLTQIDTTSFAYGDYGYIRWTVTEDQLSPKRDNLELMIADYFLPDAVPAPPVCGEFARALSLRPDDGDTTLIIGDRKTFTVWACAYHEPPQIVPFEAELLGADGAAEIVKQSGGSLSVMTADRKENIGKQVTLRVWNREMSLSAELELEIRGVWT